MRYYLFERRANLSAWGRWLYFDCISSLGSVSKNNVLFVAFFLKRPGVVYLPMYCDVRFRRIFNHVKSPEGVA